MNFYSSNISIMFLFKKETEQQRSKELNTFRSPIHGLLRRPWPAYPFWTIPVHYTWSQWLRTWLQPPHPMYFFLSNLSLTDICFISTTVQRWLWTSKLAPDPSHTWAVWHRCLFLLLLIVWIIWFWLWWPMICWWPSVSFFIIQVLWTLASVSS
jgi:hypothetical protein